MTNKSPLLPVGQMPGQFFLFLLLFFCTPIDLFGSFNVCNQSDEKALIALGYLQNGEWHAKGWWEAEAGECIKILPDISNRYYYLYAYHTKGGMWAGQMTFCTAEENFKLKKGTDCDTPFFRVDTQGSEQWTQFLYQNDNRYYSDGNGQCAIVGELTETIAVYVERFADQFLTKTIAEGNDLPVAPNASFQFALLRNGSPRVRTGKSSRHASVLIMDLPMRMVNARINWREESGGKTTWHRENIQDQTLRLQITLDLQSETREVVVHLSNYLQWDREPFYYFMDEKVNINHLIAPVIEPTLQQMNRAWQARFRPIFLSFIQGDCNWRQEMTKAIQAIEAYDRSTDQSKSPRLRTSLAKEGE